MDDYRAPAMEESYESALRTQAARPTIQEMRSHIFSLVHNAPNRRALSLELYAMKRSFIESTVSTPKVQPKPVAQVSSAFSDENVRIFRED
jgi:hypothetical protein